VAEPARRAAVLGRPVAHSLSPVLHRAAYAALGLNWAYDAIECDEDGLAPVLAARAGWAGFSCTMPLKRAVLVVADEVAPRAAAVGAGNTLLPLAGGGWRADNTDLTGIAEALREAGVRASSATVLGAGGTAQAAVVALGRAGTTRCAVLVRDVTRTAEVRRAAAAVGVTLDVGRLDPDSPHLAADLVVSTLPAGAADALAGREWHAGQSVLDAVYDPWPTKLAAAVASAGGTVVSGAAMLLHQAGAQVELMTGRAAPVAAMRAALRAAAPGCGA
jgi:shikimate dehydrogenase